MKAIVLSRKNFREYDQIISFYTEEFGKQEGLARGVKKIVSKNAAHLEPCFLVEIDMVPGKEISHVIKSIAITIFPSIRSDIKKSMMAQHIVALVHRMTDVGQTDRRIYYLLLETLQSIAEHETKISLIDAFVLRLFSLLGMQPELTRCIICEKEEELCFFSFTGGGVLCTTCGRQPREQEEKIIECSEATRIGLIAFLFGTFESTTAYDSQELIYKQIHRIIHLFVGFQTDKKISDWAKLGDI